MSNAVTVAPIRQILALHLLPAIPMALAYALFSALLVPRGYPNLLALMLAILLMEAPVSWALMIRQVRRETGGRFTLSHAFPWMDRIAWWQYAFVGLPVILVSFILMGVSGLLEQTLQPTLFSWLPEWFIMRMDPAVFSGMSRPLLLTVWGLSFFALAAIGGLTQELYFRGFLLPRLHSLGWVAPLINAALFAVFHLIAPWGWPVFFIASLIWGSLVYWKRSVKIGLFCHVGMLLLQWIMMTLIIFGLVPLPPGAG